MAGVVVGGAFLSASLQVLFDKLASRGIGDFVRGRKHEERLLVEKLTAKLLSVEAILQNAVTGRTTDSVVMGWLSELESTINEAQSLLDEIAAEGSKSKSRSQAIKEILERLEYMSRQKSVLDLIERSYISPTTSIPVHESEICGRFEDEESVVRTLLFNHGADEDPIQVLGIVGVPGIGKTTLAQLVYNDCRLEGHFDLRIWVCLSRRPSIYSVTNTIFKAVTSAACDIEDLNLLQLRLGEQLAGKKLLLVLDDVWSVEDCTEWEVLRSPFRFCAQGSSIIVTARSENVAATVGSLSAYHLKPLSNEDCWGLFSKYAFGGGYAAVDPELEAIGRDIVSKCRGLPLAAKALGVLLREKPDREEWDRILKDDAWESPRNVSDILLKLRKGMTKTRKRIQERRTMQSAETNLNATGSNSVSPIPTRNINSKRARLPVFCMLWLIILGISSSSVFKIANKFQSNRRKEALGSMCNDRAKMLQDQFQHHVNNSFSFVVFLLQVRKLHHVLDDDQCGKALSDYVSGTDSMFPFLGAVTFESLVQDEYKPIMACHRTKPDNMFAPLISGKMDIMNAIASGETVISRPFKHSDSHHLRFALITPLYSVSRLQICNSTNSPSREQKIRAASAYIGMLFNFDSLVEHVLGQLDGNQTISVAVHDVTNSSEYFLLYRSGDYDSKKSDVHESKLELGDLFRKYKITCWYNQKADLSWLVIMFTGLTTAIGLLLGCMFLGASVHSIRIQELETRAEASDAASSSFLTTASREMSTPANSIRETLVLALGMELSSPQKDYVRVAQEGCKRLIALIDEVADTRNPGFPIRRS